MSEHPENARPDDIPFVGGPVLELGKETTDCDQKPELEQEFKEVAVLHHARAEHPENEKPGDIHFVNGPVLELGKETTDCKQSPELEKELREITVVHNAREEHTAKCAKVSEKQNAGSCSNPTLSLTNTIPCQDDKGEVQGQFMIAYFKGPEENKDEAARKKGSDMDKWKKWISSLGKAVVNPGTPLKDSRLLTSDGVKTDEEKETAIMKGFAVIKAKDIDAALAIAKTDPFLQTGGSIRVSRMVRM